VTPLTVLLAHNTYQWPGGEDTAYEADAALLEAHGHRVVRYVRDNDEIEEYGVVGRAGLVAKSIWAGDTARQLRELIADARPDVAHFHNTFPLISPSAFATCRRAGVGVVTTIQNFRLGCPNGFLFRDGHVCEDCLHRRVKWPGVLHACYRDSRVQSAVVAGMTLAHRMTGAWVRNVDVFVTVSEFATAKLVESGLPADRIARRPNFLHPDPGVRAPGPTEPFVLFVGRLSPEKGVDTLVAACRAAPDVSVRVAGDGPLRPMVDAAAATMPNLEALGPLPRDEVLAQMRRARAIVVASEWYEHFPYVLLEAFASGLPAIGSDLGSTAEIVGGMAGGRLFRAGDAEDLARQLRWVVENEVACAELGRRARAAFEQEMSAGPAYERLMATYERARARAGAGRGLTGGESC
jgi:glycosyltransferase involved in cell wall biosynthesis